MAQRLVNSLHFLVTLRSQLTTLPRSDSLKANFKKPGKNGMNVFRGVMITGPPGIGKTTSTHLCAKLAGFTPIELNASDARSKKLVEVRCHSAPSQASRTNCDTE
jgi:replication factor C subunit 1